MEFLDLDKLSKEDKLLKEEIHRFAVEVVRPASAELDKIPPEERIKSNSPYFTVMKQIRKLGFHKIAIPPEKGGINVTPLQRYIIFEELGWGSAGLAVAFGADMILFACAALFGSNEIYQKFVVPWLEGEEYYGCWGVTEPEHGSDYIIMLREEPENIKKMGRANTIAEKVGDEWIIRGQKSSWVSSAPVATHCGLHSQIKGGKTIIDGIFAIVPLNIKGVRKGKVSEMLGMRDNIQGEIFFDEVRIPDQYVIVPPGFFYGTFLDQLLCLTSCGMGAIAVGLARACFELALDYARQRIQGGVPIAKHKNIKIKLYEMFEKVETARYYVRKVSEYTFRKIFNLKRFDASPRHARAAQIYAKKIAFDVAHDSLQIFGAYGLNKAFLIEKLFRDARAMLIADGTVEVLSLEAGEDVIKNYEKENYDVEYLIRLYGG